MNKKGVTLLLAVLVSSIALSIGTGIFSLLFSEIEISGSSKDSVIAFYAADSGLECALYWELLKNKDSSVPNTFSTNGSSITCNDTLYTSVVSCTGVNCTAEFYPEYVDSGASCAHVVVEKEDMGGGYVQTRLVSGGENRGQCDSVSTSLKTLQQGLEVIF